LRANGAQREVRLGNVEKQLEKNAEHRWSRRAAVIAIFVGLFGSVGAAIWWASQVDASVQHEATTRQHYDQAITEKLSDRPTRDEVLTRNELKTLRDELVRQREPTIEEWLGSLPPAKRAAVRRMIEESGGAVRDR
jgi:hypothetical protein